MSLVNSQNIKFENIIFKEPELQSIPNTNIQYKKVKFAYFNEELEKETDLILESPPNLMSYGLQEDTDMNTGKLTGYQLPIVLTSTNSSKGTPAEDQFIKLIEDITEKTKDFLVDHKDDIEKYDLVRSDLKNLSPIYRKKEKGKVVEGVSPKLYAKTIFYKNNEEIKTTFINEDENTEVNPLSTMKKRLHCKFALKVDNIFISGSKISLQLKLKEVSFKLSESQNGGPKQRMSMLCPDIPLETSHRKEILS